MDSIYREQLMEHYKNPHNKGKLTNPTIEETGNNPLCGDEVGLQLIIEGGKITEASFQGDSCAVSTAAASMLTEEIKGKSLEEVKKFTKNDLLDLLGVELTTSRIQCAVLSLDVLKDLIDQYESKEE